VTENFLILGVFLVATAYSMVGHGGASGYLALWAFTSYSAQLGSITALLLNIIVAGLTFTLFGRAKHFDWKLTWPFLVLSIPCAYLGGLFAHQSKWENWILSAVLLYAAIALVFRPTPKDDEPKNPSPIIAASIGGAIGFLSGLVGVGGGIFLSPIMILMNWARPHKVATVSAIFIFVNSISGLAARPVSQITNALALWPLFIAGAAGAVLGAWYGANRTSGKNLRIALAVVLLFAIYKHVTKAIGL